MTEQDILSKACAEARGLAIDAVHAAGIGHLGLPLGCAEIGAVLFGGELRLDPTDPRWINRDRFILSAGHGSMFLYAWLHLSGFDLPMEEIRNFRQLHSKTPGHPEFGDTPGVECTTGPLGQGVGNAVGMAVAAKMAAARFNTPDHNLLDYRVVCLAGDGCLQEGVAHEASSFAGHQKLDNLILIYDSNEVTLDAPAAATQSEDTAARYKAMGWNVVTLDGHDMEAFRKAFRKARAATGKPQLIIANTEIGRGIPEVAGTWKAHGEGGHKFADTARRGLGLPDEHFFVSKEVREHFQKVLSERQQSRAQWNQSYQSWRAANPENATLLEDGYAGKRPTAEEALQQITVRDSDKSAATRATSGQALNDLANAYPLVISGSADLHGSTKNYLDGSDDFSPKNPLGRNIRFGIREHAMGAIVNGMGYDGLFIPSGATFFTFSDYMRPSVRLASLSKLPVQFIWTHDSVGVGEDGPTHQPVETIASLRCIPGLTLIRPADNEEAAAAWAFAISHRDGPVGLVLSRQNLPSLTSIPVETRRSGTLRGAYIALEETAALDVILIASGSELQVALDAAKELGKGVRVVSMPSFEIFAQQPLEYRKEVLPDSCRKRVAVEAGCSLPWYRHVGLDGAVVGIDRFGLSAPGEQVLQELGIHAKEVVDKVRTL